MADLPFLQARKGSWTGAYVPLGIVDQRPWQTAATLAALAQSAEEKKLARDAERLADHEIDQAFSQSLRQASLAQPKLSDKALALQKRVNELQETVRNDEARIAALSAAAAAKSAGTISNGSDLEIAKAQLGLDQAELADSIEDLARESGDQRLKLQQQLVALYGRWGQQVELQQKIVIHLILQSLAFIAAICIVVILAGWGLQLASDRIVHDPRQKQTLKTVLNLGTQLVGLLLILLIIFGVPRQMPTILGLVTAGLTVVFQDFILAFCGWFVLMGPNGVRVRDWVEIDGVGGEVVQLGLFRTWLLETGNWTAHGHPTGRRVSFLNGYAIRGKYFNLSTVGQWMWDEIKVSIPPGTSIHPLLKSIYESTVKITEADGKIAEAEWKRVTHEEGSPQFSAMPSVNLRPAGAGVATVIRYITRAGVRVETRNRLFAVSVELMKGESKENRDFGVLSARARLD